MQATCKLHTSQLAPDPRPKQVSPCQGPSFGGVAWGWLAARRALRQCRPARRPMPCGVRVCPTVERVTRHASPAGLPHVPLARCAFSISIQPMRPPIPPALPGLPTPPASMTTPASILLLTTTITTTDTQPPSPTHAPSIVARRSCLSLMRPRCRARRRPRPCPGRALTPARPHY